MKINVNELTKGELIALFSSKHWFDDYYTRSTSPQELRGWLVVRRSQEYYIGKMPRSGRKVNKGVIINGHLHESQLAPPTCYV